MAAFKSLAMKFIVRESAAISVYSSCVSTTRLTVTATGARAKPVKSPVSNTATRISISVKARLVVIASGSIYHQEGRDGSSVGVLLRHAL